MNLFPLARASTGFIPSPHLPLPDPKQRKDHQSSWLHTFPLRPFREPTHASFECSCGSTPLNDPHNLAVAANLYVPLARRIAQSLGLPDHRSGSHTPSSVSFARELFDLLPGGLQEDLTNPLVVDNLRNVTSTNPDSILAPSIQQYWPENFTRRDTYRANFYPDQDYAMDQYIPDEWRPWRDIHREDVVMLDLPYYAQSAHDNWRVGSDVDRPPAPSPALGTYNPLLPATHRLMQRSPQKAHFPTYCWCGTQHPDDRHKVHVYYAFVGRTIARALEIHTQPWQESMLGKYHFSSHNTSPSINHINTLYAIMKEN